MGICNSYEQRLQMEDEVILGYDGVDLAVPAGEDLVMELGDNAGANKLSILDSDGSEVFYVDSDGNISGTLTPTLPLTLDSTVTTYTDKVGITTAFSHSGAITGIADEIAVVSMIAPTATVTDPTTADGFNYVGLAVDMSGVGITAGTGTTNVTAIGIVTNSDADVEGAYALAFADNYVEAASSYLMKMGNLGIDMVNAATGDTSFGISIDYATTDYKDGSGIIKLERSGDFTGTDAESSIDLLIAPTNEVTAPGVGEEFISAGLVIDQSGQTTAAGTGGDVVQRALYLNAASKGEAIYSASGYVTHNSTFESLDNLFQAEGVPSEDITGYGGVGVFAVENSAGTAQTNGGFIWGVSASLSGNASDTSAIYVGFVSPTVNKNGGTSTAVAHGILPGYDYALYADAAGTDMDGDNLVIKAMDGYDSGATNRNGGNIVLTPGSAANAGSNGKVGIGTASPLGKLSILDGTVSGATPDVAADSFVIDGNADTGLSILSGTSNIGRIYFGDSDDADIGYINYAHGSVNALVFGTNAAERMRLNSSGYLGIGTQNPDGHLTIVDEDVYTGIFNEAYRSGATDYYPYIQLRKARGTEASPTAVQSGDQIGGIQFAGYNGTGFAGRVSVNAFATENWSGTNQGSKLNFFTTPNTTASSVVRMTIANDGKVGIGYEDPAYKLDIVNGASGVTTVLAQLRSEYIADNTGTTLKFSNSNNASSDVGAAWITGLRTNAGTAGDTELVFEQYINGAKTETMRLDEDGLLTTTSGRIRNVTTVNAATYDLLATDDILNVTYTATAAVTSLTLPTAQCVEGRTIVIKDAGGNAGANNITVDTEGAETIDGAATAIIDGDYVSITIYSDGSNWFII